MWAAGNGHEAVVKLLLEKGADPDPEAPARAAENGHWVVLSLLLEKGSDPDPEALARAVENGHEVVLGLYGKFQDHYGKLHDVPTGSPLRRSKRPQDLRSTFKTEA